MVKLNSTEAIKDLRQIMSIHYTSRPGKDATAYGTFNRLWQRANVKAAMRDLFDAPEGNKEGK